MSVWCGWKKRLASGVLSAMLVASAAVTTVLPMTASAQGAAAADSVPSGPIRLRQPGSEGGAGATAERRTGQAWNNETALERPSARTQPARPGDFEVFVRRLAAGVGADAEQIRRLGAELMTDWAPPEGYDGLPSVPADYLVAVGDELVLNIWGSVDADLRLIVDRSGSINVPRVGTVRVAGVRFADLNTLMEQRVGQVFRGFQLNVSMGRIRQIRVYVTGFVERPGSYQVSGMSTILNALVRAGGPSGAGSFRNIQLRRGGKTLTTYDLYDLLVNGDNGADRTLQAEDVVHVSAVGTQVGLIGSVNRPGIFEMKANETLADLLKMAAGLTAVADSTRLAIERLDDRNDIRIVQVSLPNGATSRLTSGDVVRIFSAVDATLPVERQNKRVRIEGEVSRPGEYVLPAGSAVEDALRAAGGLSSSAFLFGAEFKRESVRLTQQDNYERALRDLETELARSTSTQRTSTADEAAVASARGVSTSRLIERLRAVKPSGRIVLKLEPSATSLPNLALEDGDRIYIPPQPTTVGVFGSVFNSGSYLYSNGRQLGDFLRLAGGPTRGADADSVFVVRANGSVISNRQNSSSWLSRGDPLTSMPALPGDTIFIPEEMDKATFLQKAKDWTQLVYQLGLGIGGIVAATR
jgi:protein involved in polysaccharide export with SLBB domain